ncbi:hypothetical protein [Metabacillus litoralis]|nr:hypothetical protein [Metabacillus litoralis]
MKHVPPDVPVMSRFDKGFPNDEHLNYLEDYRDSNTGFLEKYYT